MNLKISLFLISLQYLEPEDRFIQNLHEYQYIFAKSIRPGQVIGALTTWGVFLKIILVTLIYFSRSPEDFPEGKRNCGGLIFTKYACSYQYDKI